MPVKPGRRVKKGDLLARLDDAVYRNVLSAARDQIAHTRLTAPFDGMVARLDPDEARAMRNWQAHRRADTPANRLRGTPLRYAILLRSGPSPNHPWLGRSLLNHSSPTRRGRRSG